MLRNTEFMRTVIADMLRRYDEFLGLQSQLGDQTVYMRKLLQNYELQRRTLFLPLCLQQSFDNNWQPGDFMLHATYGKSHIMNYMGANPESKWPQVPRVRPVTNFECIPR